MSLDQDPIVWNLDRAMEHMAAVAKQINERDDVPREFQVEVESVITDLAGVRGLADDLGVSRVDP